MPVNSPSRQYLEASSSWQICRDVYEGSDKVKAAKTRYLPALASHGDGAAGGKAYNAYRFRALFYNAMARTVEGLTGLVFQKEPDFTVPSIVKSHLEDITLSNKPLASFALKTLTEVVAIGRYGVLIEMAEKAADRDTARPYWVGYKAEDIISVRAQRIGGEQVVTKVVLRERAEVLADPEGWETKEVLQYRVLQLAAVDTSGDSPTPADDFSEEISSGYIQTLWVQEDEDDDSKFVIRERTAVHRRTEPLARIPFVFFGPLSVSHEIQKPPLRDLADVNISHYNTMADLEHGRHYVSLPTPWVKGLRDEGDEISIGPAEVWELDPEGGGAGMLEFTGAGLGALERADEDKRAMMATLGAKLLEGQAPHAETAHAVQMRHSGEHASLRTIVGSIDQGLTMCLQWHAWWVGTDKKVSDVKAEASLNQDFFATPLTAQELTALVSTWQAEGFSWETLYYNIQRGGFARPGVEAKEERKEIESETPEEKEPQPPVIAIGPPQPGAPVPGQPFDPSKTAPPEEPEE